MARSEFGEAASSTDPESGRETVPPRANRAGIRRAESSTQRSAGTLDLIADAVRPRHVVRVSCRLTGCSRISDPWGR